MRKTSLIAVIVALIPAVAIAQGGRGGRGNAAAPAGPPTLLVPDRVWDGIDAAPHDGWVVLVRGGAHRSGWRSAVTVPADATTISCPARR
jgi:hypothetical protein